METVAEWALRFLDEHAQLALFLWMLLEEGGVPMPLPGDLVILGAGARVAAGQINWLVGLGLIEGATLLGSTILFWIARRGGRPMLLRYGRFLHLDGERLTTVEDFLARRGFWAVVVGRLTPGLRVATTVAAGAMGVRYAVFAPASLIGSNNYVLFIVGFFAGPEILQLVQGIGISTRIITIVVGLALVIGSYLYIRRRARLVTAASTLSPRVQLETAVIAGLLATATTVAVLNLALYILAALGHMSPTTALLALALQVTRRTGLDLDVLLVSAVPIYLAVHLGWAVLYAQVVRWLPKPDWLGGLVFALLPLTLTLALLFPLVGAGLAGRSLDTGLVPAAGEVLRHAIFGWTLATSYTLLSRARTARAQRTAARLPSLAA